MAIIYSYPQGSSALRDDRLIITRIDGEENEITTKQLTIGQIADYVIDEFIDPDATDFHIPVFNQGGTRITDSIISQDSVAGTSITVEGNLTTTGNLTAAGNVYLGDAATDIIRQNGILELLGPVKDSTGDIGNTEQVLVSNAQGNLVWENYQGSGLEYQSGWNADTNTPDLTSTAPGASDTGKYWVVSVAGTTDLGGITDWSPGDWAIVSQNDENRVFWNRIDNSSVDGAGVTDKLAVWTSEKTLGDAPITIDTNISSVAIGANTASGENSFAWGLRTRATNLNATAFGVDTFASGQQSTAIGDNAQATNQTATAIGKDTLASGQRAVAIGEGTKATQANTTAIGKGTTADFRNATAIGLNTTSSANASTAMGNNTTASGGNSTATGGTTYAIGTNSFSGGQLSEANGEGSTAHGISVTANSIGETIIGLNATEKAGNPTTFVETDRLFTVGNGDSTSTRSTALEILKNGNVGIGAASLSEKLNVSGNILATGTVYGSNLLGTNTGDQDVIMVELAGVPGSTVRLNAGETTGTDSTISGGTNNYAWTSIATIGGGLNNNIEPGSYGADYSTIGGGGNNYISGGSYGGRQTIGGGDRNESINADSTVAGGNYNIANGGSTTVGGGYGNQATNDSAIVGGGYNNIASGSRSSILGGGGNRATQSNAVIGGGSGNAANGYNSSVLGGYGNIADKSGAVVGGGQGNVASGYYSSILGGSANEATFDNSHVIGSNIVTNRADTTFVENLSITQIPTSATGLPSGAVYRDNSNHLKIVP